MSEWIANWMSIKPGSLLWLSDPTLVDLLGQLPTGVVKVTNPAGADVIVLFVRHEQDLSGPLDAVVPALRNTPSPWVVYRKKSWPDKYGAWVHPALAERGFGTNSVLQLHHDWTALRLVPDGQAAARLNREVEDDGQDPGRLIEVIRILRGFAAEPKLPLSAAQWPEDLAEDLDLYCGVVSWRPIVSAEVVALMNEIDEQTSEMSGEENAELWTDEAFVSHPLWKVVREKARKALDLMGAAVQ